MIFQIFIFIFMKNKINKTENNKQKHVKQSKAWKLDWLKTIKQNTQVMQNKNKKR